VGSTCTLGHGQGFLYPSSLLSSSASTRSPLHCHHHISNNAGGMKRRRQTKLAQRRRLKAAVRQWTHSSGAATAPSTRSLCGTDTIMRLSPIQRVSPDVLVLILQYSKPGRKLTVIAHLSRAFHPLPALAFLRDSLRSLLPNGCASARVWVGQLRSLTMFLEYPARWKDPGAKLFTCPRSLRSLPLARRPLCSHRIGRSR
jgi:hypothetical protein